MGLQSAPPPPSGMPMPVGSHVAAVLEVVSLLEVKEGFVGEIL